MVAELFFLLVTVTSTHFHNTTSVGTFTTMQECQAAKDEVEVFIKKNYRKGNDTTKWWCAKVDD